MNVRLEDLRGFGITASKLSEGRIATNGNALGTWLASADVKSPSADLSSSSTNDSKILDMRKKNLSSVSVVSTISPTTPLSVSTTTINTPPKWKCKRCTYANSYWLPYCEMCEKEKDTPNNRTSSSSSRGSKGKRSSTKKKRNSTTNTSTTTQITLTQLSNNNRIRTLKTNQRNKIIQAVPLTMSQIDQNTLSELPRDLQEEICSSVVMFSSSNIRPLATEKRWEDIELEIRQNLEREEWLIRIGNGMITDTNLDDLQTMLRFLEYNMRKDSFLRVLNAIQDKFRASYDGASLSYK